MLIQICIIIVIVIIVILLFSVDTHDFFKVENYTHIIDRPNLTIKNQNTLEYPYTNAKPESRYKQANNEVYINSYGNRKILNPDNYLELIEQLLDDLSNNIIDITKIQSDMLINKYYLGDESTIINFINSEINKLVNKEKYLQNNGTWKFEYFNVSDLKIHYYEVDNSKNNIEKFPTKFNLFKIIYTLGNPLRSSYTDCLAYITSINNKLQIQYTTFVTKIKDTDQKDNMNIIPKESLEFSFINSIVHNTFDKSGNSNNYSGLNYIDELHNDKIEIKADIPNEYK